MRFTITSQGISIPLELDIRGYHIEVSDMAAGSISVSDTDGRIAVCAVAAEPAAVETQSISVQAIPVESVHVETVPSEQVSASREVDNIEPSQSEIPQIVEAKQPEVIATSVEPGIENAEQLFQCLVALRKKIASEFKLPPYIIFHDKTLHDMCRLLPTDLDMLSTVPGVGQTKLEKYGLWFIQVIQEYVSHVKEVA